MIVVLKKNPDKEQMKTFEKWLLDKGLQINKSTGSSETIWGLVGDTSRLDEDLIAALDIVSDVRRIQEPYKKANRKFHPEDSVIQVGNTSVGGGSLTMIAGPCSVESEEQIMTAAHAVKAAGATMLRGGAFKPRTSPYAFQGLHEEGIRLLKQAGDEVDLPIVSEIMDVTQLDACADVDVLQIGARNMQNFELLKELGRSDKPILLKRGLCATYQELLMSAEYIMAEGNQNVILCERGIRTFETYTRNTLDLSITPALRSKTHLPIIIDPSHAAGRVHMVPDLSYAAVASGADGLIIEVHPNPQVAKSDAAQQLTCEGFQKVCTKCFAIKEILSEMD